MYRIYISYEADMQEQLGFVQELPNQTITEWLFDNWSATEQTTEGGDMYATNLETGNEYYVEGDYTWQPVTR